MSWLKTALGVAASAYVKDAVLRPKQVGNVARVYCDRVRKPLLLVHGDGLVHRLLGEPARADMATTRAYPIAASPKAFGAVLAVGVLERLRRPDRALTEWHRVADKVFVVVPSWWSPHAWLDLRNRWFIDSSLKSVTPLWTSADGTRLLAVSDSGYGSPRCNLSPPMTSPSRSMTNQVANQRSSIPNRSTGRMLPPPSALPQQPQNQPSPRQSEEVSGPPQEISSDGLEFVLENQPSESSSSVSSLTVVSMPESFEN